MIYIDGYTTEEWCEKHGIEVEVQTCSGCGKDFPLNVPILIKGYAGLEMEYHGCPRNRLAACFTPIGEDEKKFWSRII